MGWALQIEPLARPDLAPPSSATDPFERLVSLQLQTCQRGGSTYLEVAEVADIHGSAQIVRAGLLAIPLEDCDSCELHSGRAWVTVLAERGWT